MPLRLPGSRNSSPGSKPPGTMNPWLQRSCDDNRWRSQVAKLLEHGYLSQRHPWVISYDLERLGSRVAHLRQTFPAESLHTSAIKANPLPPVLKMLVDGGMGLEAASRGELELAYHAGCTPDKIVFDSPAKTKEELEHAASSGVTVNANSEQELERLSESPVRGKVGLRCNPAVAGAARASATMVATAGSKFGVTLEEARAALQKHPFVSGLHVHVGSQVATLEELVEAAARVVELAERFEQITWLDIGGGLPARYAAGDEGLPLELYLRRLKQRVPSLTKYPLTTELGRALHANCAWAASVVEYVADGRAILHFGADFCLRECYQPQSWWHQFTVLTGKGEPKSGETTLYDLYGPLCFAGDRVAGARELPRLEPGDIVVMHDVGAYTLSMWSRYCSRAMPEVVGFKNGDFQVLRRREEPQELVKFWSGML